GLDTLVELVDRNVYPLAEFPAGQWDYMFFYQENFDRATTVFAANPRRTLTALFRAGGAEQRGLPTFTASVRAEGGWFGGLDEAPAMPLDTRVISEADLEVYVDSVSRNGFFGPDAYYMNHEANAEFSKQARHNGNIDLPVLFLAARYDYVCETVDSRLAEPMRKQCSNLTEVTIDGGHWLAQEKPQEVNTALKDWLLKL
ncbi:MAG: alpha/beta hydrolase, partial [Pseudomonadota bacterium]